VPFEEEMRLSKSTSITMPFSTPSASTTGTAPILLALMNSIARRTF
jgi:hypothetical protein